MIAKSRCRIVDSFITNLLLFAAVVISISAVGWFVMEVSQIKSMLRQDVEQTVKALDQSKKGAASQQSGTSNDSSLNEVNRAGTDH
jgi:hypothetical protein